MSTLPLEIYNYTTDVNKKLILLEGESTSDIRTFLVFYLPPKIREVVDKIWSNGVYIVYIVYIQYELRY